LPRSGAESRSAFKALMPYPYARGAEGMEVREDFELLESLFVELDPLVEGFAGVLR
jgi:hypothetical protein